MSLVCVRHVPSLYYATKISSIHEQILQLDDCCWQPVMLSTNSGRPALHHEQFSKLHLMCTCGCCYEALSGFQCVREMGGGERGSKGSKGGEFMDSYPGDKTECRQMASKARKQQIRTSRHHGSMAGTIAFWDPHLPIVKGPGSKVSPAMNRRKPMGRA